LVNDEIFVWLASEENPLAPCADALFFEAHNLQNAFFEKCRPN
jgi:hypothetical protein